MKFSFQMILQVDMPEKNINIGIFNEGRLHFQKMEVIRTTYCKHFWFSSTSSLFFTILIPNNFMPRWWWLNYSQYSPLPSTHRNWVRYNARPWNTEIIASDHMLMEETHRDTNNCISKSIASGQQTSGSFLITLWNLGIRPFATSSRFHLRNLSTSTPVPIPCQGLQPGPHHLSPRLF